MVWDGSKGKMEQRGVGVPGTTQALDCWRLRAGRARWLAEPRLSRRGRRSRGPPSHLHRFPEVEGELAEYLRTPRLLAESSRFSPEFDDTTPESVLACRGAQEKLRQGARAQGSVGA